LEADQTPVVSDLLERLRARVEERRAAGAYPPGLEHDLDVHFRHIVEHRPVRNLDALHRAMATFEEGLRFDAGLIPTGSRVPGGQVLHQAAAKLVTRQTDWIVQQLREFAESVRVMLWTMIATLDDPTHVHAELTAQIDAILDRLAYYERSPADAPMLGSIVRRLEGAEARRQLRPWYRSERLAEELQGSRSEVLAAYRPLAERFAGSAPVADLGCGRGELLEALGNLGVEATGVEADAELAKAAAGRGLKVDHDDAIRWLAATAPESLGGIALLAVAQSLSAQELLDVVALAAEKLRPGGTMIVTAGPGEGDPSYQRPVHPAYLAFLFREAGFADVAVEAGTVTATR
jgi:SAM-dependent methyltransferase